MFPQRCIHTRTGSCIGTGTHTRTCTRTRTQVCSGAHVIDRTGAPAQPCSSHLVGVVERRVPAQQNVENDTQTPNVHLLAVLLATQDLRRDVADRYKYTSTHTPRVNVCAPQRTHQHGKQTLGTSSTHRPYTPHTPRNTLTLHTLARAGRLPRRATCRGQRVAVVAVHFGEAEVRDLDQRVVRRVRQQNVLRLRVIQTHKQPHRSRD